MGGGHSSEVEIFCEFKAACGRDGFMPTLKAVQSF